MTSAPPDSHTHLRHALRSTAEHAFAEARTYSPAAATGRSGVDGVGVTLVVDGESVFVGANAFTDVIDKVQYGLDQGPCLSAVASGRVVTSTRIGSTERRWPHFARRAAAHDLRAVSSAPMTADGAVVGSVNVYSRTPYGLESISPQLLRGLADTAEVSLRGPRLLALAGSAGRRLADALDERADVERAVGLLMDRYAMGADEARVLLAQLARQDGTTEAAAARGLTDAAPGDHPHDAPGLG